MEENREETPRSKERHLDSKISYSKGREISWVNLKERSVKLTVIWGSETNRRSEIKTKWKLPVKVSHVLRCNHQQAELCK